MSSEIFKIQDLEAPKGTKKQGFLKIHEKPAGSHKIPITLINGSGDGPTLVINGGEHGSEYNGPAGCLKLCDELNPEEINGQIILVPVVNTLAFEYRWMHGNPIDYRNLGSCYVKEIPLGGSGHPLHSYQVATTFYREVLKKADYRLNLHGGDIEEDLLTGTMYNRTNIDKGRDDENLSLARNFGWEWIREGISKKKRESSNNTSLKMPMTVGTEAGGMGRCQSDIVDMVFKGCINIMKYLDMIKGNPEIPPKAKVYNPYHLYAEKGGFFISNVRSGDLVSEGDVLGVIKNLFGKVVEEIVVPTDGVIHMITSPAIWERDVVYEIGKDIREID